MGIYFPGDKLNIAVDNNLPMSISGPGAMIDSTYFRYGFLKLVWSGADAINGTFIIEASLDGSGGWEKYPNSDFVATTASGTHYWLINLWALPYFRINYSAGANTSGVFSSSVRFEVPG